MRLRLLLLLTGLLAACARTAPQPPQLSTQERLLLEILYADKRITPRGLVRRDDGVLVAWTAQDGQWIEYELVPDAKGLLAFRRLPTYREPADNAPSPITQEHAAIR